MNLRRVRSQLAMEARLTLTNGESMLLILGIPVLLLLFFGSVDVLPTGSVADDPVDFLVPGVLALGVMSTSFVNLAISTGFDRQYGVLKRLGSTPLTRAELLGAKIITLLVLEVVQFAAILGVGAALGWPGEGVSLLPGIAIAAAGSILATIAFAGLGFFIAGTMRGLVALAVANALYLVLLLVSGVIIPLAEFSATVRSVVRLLPTTALAEIVHAALSPSGNTPARAWVVLVIWAAVSPPVAARWFRWSPD